KRCDEKQAGQNNPSNLALDKRQPNYRLRTKQLCDDENASDPQKRAEGRNCRKLSNRHREQSGCKISRQAGPCYELAGEQCDRAVLVESYLTALDCCSVGKSRDPAPFSDGL